MSGEAAIHLRQRWRNRYADLLRRAVDRAPEAVTHPRFLEPTLVGGISTLIARKVIAGRGEQLQELLPGLLEFVLASYLGP
jgi:hypothetical protein